MNFLTKPWFENIFFCLTVPLSCSQRPPFNCDDDRDKENGGIPGDGGPGPLPGVRLLHGLPPHYGLFRQERRQRILRGKKTRKAVLRIRDPGSRIRIFPSRIRIKEFLSILTLKIVSKLLEIWSGLFIPDPDPDVWPIPDPGSRIQGSKRHRIPDPQHCLKVSLVCHFCP